MESMVETIHKLYKEGRFEEALKIILSAYQSTNEMPDEILEIEAWCRFRFKEYEKANESALVLSGRGNSSGLEIQAQIAAYVTKDDKLLEKLYWQKPKNPGIANAIAIRARDEDSVISTTVVVCAAMGMMNDNRISSIHVINNTARLIFERSYFKSHDDIIMAIGFWQIALEKYGDGNYHHRAAVHFWMSKAYERLGEKSLAIKSAQKSLTLWVKQISLDPSNPKFNENFTGAEKRLEDLKR